MKKYYVNNKYYFEKKDEGKIYLSIVAILVGLVLMGMSVVHYFPDFVKTAGQIYWWTVLTLGGGVLLPVTGIITILNNLYCDK